MTRPRGSRFSVWLRPEPIRRTSVKRGGGLRIGLLGGSFNPAHEGHRAISVEALRRLQLHQVWWLVSPQNPLKDPGENTPYEERFERARAIARHPRIIVSDLERQWSCYYTIETVSLIRERYPLHDFTWLMGADNFATLHRWEDWTDIADQMTIAVLDRPGYLLAAAASPAASRYAAARLPARSAALLPGTVPPAWSLIEIPLNWQSSTALRQQP